MWYFDKRSLSFLPSPTLNNREYFLSHSSGNIPNVPSLSWTKDCLEANAFLISLMPTRWPSKSNSTFASNQSNPLLTWICVDGLAVLKRKFLSASKPNTGTFDSFIESTNRKNQLFFNTSGPFNIKLFPSSGRINCECNELSLSKNRNSASLFLWTIKILSPSGMVMVSLSDAFVSKPLYVKMGWNTRYSPFSCNINFTSGSPLFISFMSDLSNSTLYSLVKGMMSFCICADQFSLVRTMLPFLINFSACNTSSGFCQR